MDVETFGDPADPDLAFVLGWGNRPEHETVQWLIDHLADHYRVHAVRIPENPVDFRSQYLAPVREYVADLGTHRLLGHSTGGLICSYLRSPDLETRTFLSPWWDIPDRRTGLLFSVVVQVPTSRRVLPADDVDRDVLGELATDRQIADVPRKVSPAFVRTIRRAQRSLPPFDEDAAVFYAPDDRVVCPRAIERRAPESNRVAYEGGHELFSSPVRDEHLPTLLAAVEDGVEAIR